MAYWMPTQPGDALILKTAGGFRTHAVGPVRQDGQQDFRNQLDILHARRLTDAIATARTLLSADGRIFLRSIDTGDWSTVSAMDALRMQERKSA